MQNLQWHWTINAKAFRHSSCKASLVKPQQPCRRQHNGVRAISIVHVKYATIPYLLALLRFPISEGIIPVKSFVDTRKNSRFESCPMLVLIVPDSRFLSTENEVTFAKLYSSSGMVPVNRFSYMSKISASQEEKN